MFWLSSLECINSLICWEKWVHDPNNLISLAGFENFELIKFQFSWEQHEIVLFTYLAEILQKYFVKLN